MSWGPSNGSPTCEAPCRLLVHRTAAARQCNRTRSRRSHATPSSTLASLWTSGAQLHRNRRRARTSPWAACTPRQSGSEAPRWKGPVTPPPWLPRPAPEEKALAPRKGARLQQHCRYCCLQRALPDASSRCPHPLSAARPGLRAPRRGLMNHAGSPRRSSWSSMTSSPDRTPADPLALGLEAAAGLAPSLSYIAWRPAQGHAEG
mmetsp:Transcript_35383/g.75365  ORF Transcript_35383/g.75365 Transcript_35383/m.75365 type:complete len:204 (+) Transcript_35383:69-680(+)